MANNYDFSGWATRNDLLCSDGRTIRKDAFKDCDGMEVPLVWNHMHGGVDNVLGHAMLQNQPEGVRAYGVFNETSGGRKAREMVRHGDIKWLSIYANQLKQNGGDVIHGVIREVSLVLAGANPGATIDTVLSHSDDGTEEAIISTEFEIMHSDEDDVIEEKEEKEMAKEEKEPVVVHAEEAKDKGSKDMTVQEVYNTMNEDQKKVCAYLVELALEEKSGKAASDKGDEEMNHNAFDTESTEQDNVLTHDEMASAFKDAARYGSIKESFLQHGIDNIEYLFPEETNLNKTPEFIKRKDDWVGVVMNGVHHTPFSRIKSQFADITEVDARAKGYIKGKYKKEEVFGLLKRTTTPTTIYKKQKLDRDDVIDITDLDIVAFIKGEMRVMLDEELARAFLIGDGRSSSSDDKINESNIRPIWTDEDLFTIKYPIVLSSTTTDDAKAKAIIKAAVKSRIDYRGSGSPVLFTTEDILTDMLLIEDGYGRRLYNNENDLATAMRVSRIVTVPVMEGQSRVVDSYTHFLAGIIVNLGDYNVGADKGGAINMFDDFDIDYNQQKYLIETRCSGALTKPYSAIALEIQYGNVLTVAPTPAATTQYGKLVSDLQDSIIINDDSIEGHLNYVTGYTQFSGNVEEQQGNYLALKMTAPTGATTTVELLGGTVGAPVTLDSEMTIVIRVSNKKTQKVRVVMTPTSGEKITKVYSLRLLECDSAS